MLHDLARKFGAACSTDLGAATTHVVCTAADSDEARWALQTQRFVVQPSWLVCCALTWQHVREQEFAVQ